MYCYQGFMGGGGASPQTLRRERERECVCVWQCVRLNVWYLGHRYRGEADITLSDTTLDQIAEAVITLLAT